MYEVERVFAGKTDVWMTVEVYEAIEARDKTRKPALLRKIAYFSEAGFQSHEGKKGQPIKHEEGGVYRIGLNDLFRVYGFYSWDDDHRRNQNFIIIACSRRQKGKEKYIPRKGDHSQGERGEAEWMEEKT